MKMVKSLLLGSAAGLVAMTGAQAADLPVKAKPVQYVKICSLYGAGFYYIPGTDTCLKIGGWVRMQMGYGYAGNMSNGPLATNPYTRANTDFNTRNRGYITADARSQTEYGTLRAYIAVGTSNDNATNASTSSADTGTLSGVVSPAAFSANRAFIQIAGFTAGRAQSFFDFTDNAALSYNGATAWYAAGTTTGDPGWQVLAYTAQFGNGLSATLSVEESRNKGVIRYTTAGTADAASATSGQDGNKMPDFVANLRVDQAWGSAQVMGAIHDASALYYAGTTGSGHPGNVLGYAFGAGVKINLPMLGAGDYIDLQASWSKGAASYSSAGGNLSKANGAQSGSLINNDGTYGTTGDVNLTKAWGVFGGLQHFWNPKLKTSLYGGYVKVDHSDAANLLICAAGTIATGCDSDAAVYHIGTRTAWAPVPNLEVGVDVMYSALDTRNTGVADTSHDQSAWTGHLRIQRNFYP